MCLCDCKVLGRTLFLRKVCRLFWVVLFCAFGPEKVGGAAEGFTSVGPMCAARHRHTLTLLADGTVLVAGGGDGGLGAHQSAELYLPNEGRFVNIGNLACKREAHTATLLQDGRVLIAGSFNNENMFSAELYDPVSKTFTRIADMRESRGFHTATLLHDGKVLLVGGYTNMVEIAGAELFDPATGSFTEIGPTQSLRIGHNATLLYNGQVLLLGGTRTGERFAELYDPVTKRFKKTGPLMQRQDRNPSATLLSDGRVLIVGELVEIFHPDTGQFRECKAFFPERQQHTATLLCEGKVLLVGGVTSKGLFVGETFKYDPAADAFTFVGALQQGRAEHRAVALRDGRVLFSGGSATNVSLNWADVYNPGELYPYITSFKAEPEVLLPGQSSQLLAQFSGGDGVIMPGFWGIQSNVPTLVRPQADTTFILSVTGPSGLKASAKVHVKVK